MLWVLTKSASVSQAAWDAIYTEINPNVHKILSLRFGHENISNTILPLLLIQEEKLSFNGKECILNTGKLSLRILPRNSVVRRTDLT